MIVKWNNREVQIDDIMFIINGDVVDSFDDIVLDNQPKLEILLHPIKSGQINVHDIGELEYDGSKMPFKWLCYGSRNGVLRFLPSAI